MADRPFQAVQRVQLGGIHYLHRAEGGTSWATDRKWDDYVTAEGATEQEASAHLRQAVDQYCKVEKEKKPTLYMCKADGKPEVERKISVADYLRRFFLRLGS